VRDEPLSLWSDVTLVFWDVPRDLSLSTVYDEIRKRNPGNRDSCIADLREYEYTTRSQRAELAEHPTDV
jgi:hypothetical protein